MSDAPHGQSDSPADPPLLTWAREFLPHYFGDQPADFHRELMANLVAPQRRLIARVAPRGHAKSTCAALAYPLWCACTGHRKNVVIITHEASLARQFVQDIRTELETNERIIAAHGELFRATADSESGVSSEDACESPKKRKSESATKRGASAKKSAAARKSVKRASPKRAARVARTTRRPRRTAWTRDKLITTTGVTIQAKGVGASLRGTRVGPQRPDLIICDDIEKDETIATPDGRRKLENWLLRVVMPALAPKGQLVILGSLIHYDSLLANLRDRTRFPRWDYRVYRALEFERIGDEYYPKPLWPGRWSVQRLNEERERVGTLAFEQEYQANPIDDSLRPFKPEWLQRYDESELVDERLITLMAVDPATGVEGGDFFAIWIGSVDIATGVIYTREILLERIGFVEQVKRIMAAFERWRPLKVGIETTAYQTALKDILEHNSRERNIYMPLVGLNPVRSKRARIEASAPFYENGTMRLPRALPPEVESQFLGFPRAKHDDAPDVCVMGIELARTLTSATRVEGAVRDTTHTSRRGGW